MDATHRGRAARAGGACVRACRSPVLCLALLGGALAAACAQGLPRAAGAAGQGAQAGPPVTIIEGLRGQVAGLELMDYVGAGRVIRLAPGETLVLGYLESCWRETITGGTVTVGPGQSSVQGGRVERTRVPCDTGRLQIGAREATQGAATVYRSLRPDAGAPPPPLQVVYGLAPVFDVGARRGTLLIERLDDKATRVELPVEAEALVAGRFVDLARTPLLLEAGASYAARLGALRLEFKVDWDARPGATPIAGRLLRFE